MLRRALIASIGAGSVLAVTSLSDNSPPQAILIPQRLARDAFCAINIIRDYKQVFFTLKDKPIGSIEREVALNDCHARGAQRLLGLCFANGGIYTKLGQHIGQLDHLLPEPYVVTMRQHLLDACPVSSLSEVKKIIKADLGADTSDLFTEFDPIPIASASLAQVHVARDKEGRKLAVKVQHPGLRETAAADIATINVLVNVARYFFPDFDFRWLVDEIKHNLPLELDFEHEARNAAQCKSNLARSRLSRQVHVPDIHPALSSSRVLTMEFIDGVPVDAQKLRKAGFAPKDLSRLIATTFNEMIFSWGFVHCDPHAANLLVRKNSSGDMQLVLLDHGLYKTYSDEFRIEYARLWRALILADEQLIKESCDKLNAGGAVDIFCAMLTQRPWEDIVDKQANHLSVPNTKEHKEKAQAFAADNAANISALLLKMPRPLLLLLKTNDCLRSVDFMLGNPVNSFIICARECTRALAQERIDKAKKENHWLFQSRLRNLIERLGIEIRIMGLHMATSSIKLS
jgi:aarF domain-containing kinase